MNGRRATARVREGRREEGASLRGEEGGGRVSARGGGERARVREGRSEESRKTGSFDSKGLGKAVPAPGPPLQAARPAQRPAGQELEHRRLLKVGKNPGPC